MRCSTPRRTRSARPGRPPAAPTASSCSTPANSSCRPSAGSSAGPTSRPWPAPGFPMAQQRRPVPIVLGRADGATYGAALTFLSRIAVSAGRVIPVEMGRPDALGDQPAIFVGALGQFSAPDGDRVRRRRRRAHGMGGAGTQPERRRRRRHRSRPDRPQLLRRFVRRPTGSMTAGRTIWSARAAFAAAGSNSSAGSSGISTSPSPRSPSSPAPTRRSTLPTERRWSSSRRRRARTGSGPWSPAANAEELVNGVEAITAAASGSALNGRVDRL